MQAARTTATPERIIQSAFGFMASKTVLSAVEIGLFTELAKGPLDANALGERLGIHPRARRDFFDTLVALGFLQREREIYSNATEADLYLDRAKPTYIGGLLEMMSTRLYGHWANLTEALKTGRPQSEAKSGGDVFESLYHSPEALRRFLNAMTGLSRMSARAISAQFPWEQYRTFCDVGCAAGAVVAQIALEHPHLKGLGYDLPKVRPVFEEHTGSFGLNGRVKFRGGDFFREPLPAVDVLIMGHILHDWDLETKQLLVRKAYDALLPGGALIVYDAMIDDERRHRASGLLASLNMLIETPGGYDYTTAEARGWLQEAGFKDIRTEPLGSVESMVAGWK